MVVNELIKELGKKGLVHGECLGRHWGLCDAAAEAIESLQAQLATEKTKYKELQRYNVECIKQAGELMSEKMDLQAQLAQVTEERDAAVEEINGMCWCCVHGKKYKNAPAWSDLTSCKYMNKRGLVASAGRGGKNCSHWEWRRPGKEERP